MPSNFFLFCEMEDDVILRRKFKMILPIILNSIAVYWRSYDLHDNTETVSGHVVVINSSWSELYHILFERRVKKKH
jgi:hypothetical protein